MAGADVVGSSSVEKLDDVIVRPAEQVSSQIRAAKEAISTVIFGQDRVIENTLVTILSGGHALLIGVPGLAKTKLVETLGTTLGVGRKRHPVHAGFDAVGYSGRGSARRKRHRQALVPFHLRSGVRAA